MPSRQHHRGLLVVAALLAAPAPRPLAGQAAALPRLLPVRAQRTPPQQSPARRPYCGSRDMTHTTTLKPNKSDAIYRARSAAAIAVTRHDGVELNPLPCMTEQRGDSYRA